MSTPEEIDIDSLPDDLKVCNCASCGVLMTSDVRAGSPGFPIRVRGHINGRPYCKACLMTPSKIPNGQRLGKTLTESNPGNENGVKALEEDR